MNVADLIKDHEGTSLSLYRCTAGKWTVGIGRNIEDNGIRQDEADLMLANDIRECRLQLLRAYPWFNALDEVRQAALIDLMFCLGPMRLGGFKKFLAATGRGDWPRAAEELRSSKWFEQVARRGPRVAAMIETARWPE